jgi:hypothetical protein
VKRRKVVPPEDADEYTLETQNYDEAKRDG